LALPRSPQDEQRWHRAVARARESIGVPAFDAAVAKGRAWPTGDAVQRALAGEEKELMPA